VAYPASYQWVTRTFMQVEWPGHDVTTHLSLATRLRMSGAIPLLPQSTFMAQTGPTILLLYNSTESNKTEKQEKPYSGHNLGQCTIIFIIKISL
jgi:hypothetical protein